MASVAHRGQASGAAPRNNSYSTLYASPTNSDFSEADADAIKYALASPLRQNQH